jgi:hypothetical protein
MKMRRLALGVLTALCAGACGDDDASSATSVPDSGAERDGGSGPGGDADGATSTLAPLPTGTFRIGVWCGIPASELTKGRFDELAAAGVTTMSFACEGPFDTPAYNKLMLPLAKSAGLDAIIMDVRLEAAILGVEVDSNVEGVAKEYADETALAGYHIKDEPGAGEFPALARVVAGLAARDPKRFASINLFPDYAGPGLGAPSYDAYVEQYLSVVKPKLFSFDYYPFLNDGTDEPGYFGDLEVIRAHSIATRTPFWQYVQAITFGNRRQTTGPEKLWIGTQTLAYGGMGISYFTYWSPPQTAENFGNGIIDRQGHPTAQYGEIKANNARLSAFGRYLVAAKSTAVFHNGALARGTVPREPGMPVYLPNAAPITVGLFESSAGVFAFLANRDYTKTTESDVYLATTGADPEVLDVASGKLVPMKVEARDATGTKVHVSIAPADGALIHLRGPVPKGPPGAEAFVGTVRGSAGSLDVVDKSFGAARLRGADWNDCPAGYDLAGRDFQANGFWLCVRKDLAARTFLVGNVVADTGTLYAVKGGTATARGTTAWDACPNATLLGRRFESNGFWVCIE